MSVTVSNTTVAEPILFNLTGTLPTKQTAMVQVTLSMMGNLGPPYFNTPLSYRQEYDGSSVDQFWLPGITDPFGVGATMIVNFGNASAFTTNQNGLITI